MTFINLTIWSSYLMVAAIRRAERTMSEAMALCCLMVCQV